MKKILIILIGILVSIFIVISLVVKNDNKYRSSLEDIVIKNSDIEEIEYVNYYDDFYIVMDYEYLYLLDNKFTLILNINKDLLFKEYYKYDIVYRNMTLMLMNNYTNKEGIIFEYYDIYTGECIDKIVLD